MEGGKVDSIGKTNAAAAAAAAAVAQPIHLCENVHVDIIRSSSFHAHRSAYVVLWMHAGELRKSDNTRSSPTLQLRLYNSVYTKLIFIDNSPAKRAVYETSRRTNSIEYGAHEILHTRRKLHTHNTAPQRVSWRVRGTCLAAHVFVCEPSEPTFRRIPFRTHACGVMFRLRSVKFS